MFSKQKRPCPGDMEHQVVMEWYLTFYEPNQNEIITLWLLKYDSALIHQGVLLKLVIFKNLHKLVIFNFIGIDHDKFKFILKI